MQHRGNLYKPQFSDSKADRKVADLCFRLQTKYLSGNQMQSKEVLQILSLQLQIIF